MKFQARSKEELAGKDLLPAGWYDFEVMSAEETTSKAGNEMIKVKLRVFNPKGPDTHIYSYLMEQMQDRLLDFCETANIMDKYEAGVLRAVDCMDRTGKVKVAVEEDKNGKYPPQNVVKSYAAADQVGKSNKPPIEQEEGPDIPF